MTCSPHSERTVNTFFLVMIILGSAIGLVALIMVLRKAFSRGESEIGGWQIRGARQTIIAMARTTVAEGIRTKVVAGFVLIVLITVPCLYLLAEGDGTIKGRVQMFMNYSLGLPSFFLGILTILFSCRSLSNEIVSHQIFGIASKPVPRWQIVVGKWLGVMSIDVVLLGLVGLGTYVGTIVIVKQFENDLEHALIADGGLSPQQSANAVSALSHVRGVGKKGIESPIIGAMAQATGMSPQQVADVLLKLSESMRVDLRRYDELRRQVLVARATVTPTIPEDKIAEEVERRFQSLKKEGNLPETMTAREAREQLAIEEFSKYCTVPPMTTMEWSFQGPQPEKRSDFIMSLRFKIQVGATVPAFRDSITGYTLEKDTLDCIWGIGDPRTANAAVLEYPQPIRVFQETEIPINCVEEDGTIYVAFFNRDPRNVEAVFDLPNALQVLYRVGSFELNVFQACLAILIYLTCLASFGVCLSAFFSSAGGSIILIIFALIWLCGGFIAESVAVTEEYAPQDPGLDWEVRKIMVDSLTEGLSFGDLSPRDDLMEGRVIGWPRLWTDCWRYALIKSGVALLIGVLVLRRRELAAVIV